MSFTKRIIFLNLFIYLAVPGLSCSVWNLVRFSSCSVWAQELWHLGLNALQHVGFSQIGDRTGVLCTLWLIVNHWTTWEAWWFLKWVRNFKVRHIYCNKPVEKKSLFRNKPVSEEPVAPFLSLLLPPLRINQPWQFSFFPSTSFSLLT